ncbi:MAG: PQQ-binding-like beta-propeller repeat protein, partial [Calditrichaeota bacterium]|nr:PQQ-binding-like beta-propeller repeat protein [Calditrichota bacterium]
GAGGLGHTLLKQPPLEWDVGAGRNVLWKVAVPLPGFSSPVVWGKRLFLTGGDATVRKVFCFDAESGAILWEKEVATTLDNPLIAGADGHAGYAAATPATDGNYVCAIFATGDLACFDVEGNAVWARNLGRPDNHYGHSSSLILEDGRVFVQFDQNSNSKLYAFEVATGEVAWETGRSVISWASPILAHTGSRSELILANCETVDAYNPQTGEQLWSVACMAGEMGPSPAWADGLVFAANDYARAVGIRATGNNAQVIWEFDEDLPDAASPLATARYLYLPTSYGFLVCLDAKTGEKIWDAEFDYGFEASPISTGEYIYALDKGGTMHIFRPGDTYTSVADIPLGEKSGSTPALVEGRIYIRGEEHLFCIGTGD